MSRLIVLTGIFCLSVSHAAGHGGFVPVTTACAAEDAFYYAAECSPPAGRTWGLAQRDGANRPTPPYLSSLVGGEVETGKIASPPFKIEVDTIRFTVRGHDGQGGGRNENYVALVDNKTGKTVRRTPAPGHDALQQRAWQVADLRGRMVRFEAVDGNADSAFAWLGIGMVDAGSAMSIDFRNGLPDDWQTESHRPAKADRKQMAVESPVPFLAYQDTYTWVRDKGATHVQVGSQVEYLFVLGCTVPANHVLATYGYVDIVYADNVKDTIPLVFGFTLESSYKTEGNYPSSRLRPVANGAQYMLAIRPADKVVDYLVLRRADADMPRPRISAITCRTAKRLVSFEKGQSPLTPLPSGPVDDELRQWLAQHAVSTGKPDVADLADDIRKERGEPVTLAEIRALESEPPVRFSRRKISDEAFEAAAVGDIDGDGQKDIISGNFWYGGPQFDKRTRFRSLETTGGYHDSFHDFPMDVDGDGDLDVVTGGWFGATLLWCENPGLPAGNDWKTHEIARTGPIETTRFWDIDGDGHVEVVPNAGGNVVFYRLVRDAAGRGTGRFTKHEVKIGGAGHGIGFGDVNGDGRGDLVIPDGWLEAPADPLREDWTLHADFHLGSASVPILVHDVNEDGQADLIFGKAHGYGLYWLEQSSVDGKTTWTTHLADEKSSQYHDMMLVDLDGDRRPELVTGKRYHAHNGKDPGSADPLFVRYFVMRRPGVMAPHTVDFGPASTASGVGIYFWVDDVNGDGAPDVIAPGKEGLYLFTNLASQR